MSDMNLQRGLPIRLLPMNLASPGKPMRMDQNLEPELPQLPTAEVVSLTLKELFADVQRLFRLAAEHGREDPEHVHQVRIATRRMDEALRLFADFLPRGRTRELRRQLSQLRNQVNPLRDDDVFVGRLAGESSDPAVRTLVALLHERRASEQAELSQLFQCWLRDETLESRFTAVLFALHARRSQAARGNETFGKFARRRLRRAARQFFAGPRADTRRPKRLHRFRLRAKHLRYSVELLRPGLVDEPAGRAYDQVKKLTQRLGDINDHATALRLIRELSRGLSRALSAGGPDAPLAAYLRQVRRDERSALRAALAEFQDWWSPRRRKRLRRRLKKAWMMPPGRADDDAAE